LKQGVVDVQFVAGVGGLIRQLQSKSRVGRHDRPHCGRISNGPNSSNEIVGHWTPVDSRIDGLLFLGSMHLV
jgi:hypothetical protein